MDNNTLDDVAELLQIESEESPPPYADEMKELAERILDDINLQENMDTLEEAGRSALAILLNLYADGELPSSESIKFLKSLVEKKTPPPIQRIEQNIQFDMRALIGDIVKANPDKLQAAIELSNQRKEEVKVRLQLDNTLQLAPADTEDDEENEFYEFIEDRSNEPDEIKSLRRDVKPSDRRPDDVLRPSETHRSFASWARR